MTDTMTITLDEQLLAAASNNQKRNVKQFIKAGANVNARNQNNQTALIIAAYNGYHSTVAVLLKMPGIDIMAQDLGNCTALFYASENPNVALRILAHMTQEQINSELSTEYLSISQMVGRYHKEITELKGNIFRSIFAKSMWSNLAEWENKKSILIKTELCSVPRPKWCPKFLYVKQIHDAIDVIDKSLETLSKPKNVLAKHPKTIAFYDHRLRVKDLTEKMEDLTISPAKKSGMASKL